MTWDRLVSGIGSIENLIRTLERKSKKITTKTENQGLQKQRTEKENQRKTEKAEKTRFFKPGMQTNS